MKGSTVAGEAHRQYSDMVSAFRRLLPGPKLRLKFSAQMDGFIRQCVLGVWHADSGSSLSERYVEFYEAIWSGTNKSESVLFFELCAQVSGYGRFSPPGFFPDLIQADLAKGTRLAWRFADQLAMMLLLFAAVDDSVSPEEAAFIDSCANSLRAQCPQSNRGQNPVRASDFITRPADPGAKNPAAKGSQQKKSPPPPPKAPAGKADSSGGLPDLSSLDQQLDDLLNHLKQDSLNYRPLLPPDMGPLTPTAPITPGTPEQPESPARTPAQSPEEKKEAAEAPPEKPDLNEVMAELDALCGLEQVKKDVKSLVNLVKVRKMRQEAGLPIPAISLHLVFLGNPGTGKTTVARLLSKIYCAIGVLSKGQLVEVDRSGLVAGFVGQTAGKTQAVIDKAMGGVLFIDEAYALANKENANDFGGEAIEVLLKNMEDHRDDLIVIVAGYTGPMEKFIHANPGLESRFNKYFFFEDYNADQLMEIFRSLVKKNGYTLSPSAEQWAKDGFRVLYATRDENFGNARDVRNLFEKAIAAQADRVAQMEAPTREQLMELTREDLSGKPEQEPEKESGKEPAAEAPEKAEEKPSAEKKPAEEEPSDGDGQNP